MKKLLTISLATLGAFTVFASGAAEAHPTSLLCKDQPSREPYSTFNKNRDDVYKYGPLKLIFDGKEVVVKGGSEVSRKSMRQLLRSISPRRVDPNVIDPETREPKLETPAKWIARLIGPSQDRPSIPVPIPAPAPNPDEVQEYDLFIGTEGILYYTWVRAAQLFFINDQNPSDKNYGKFFHHMKITPHGRIAENGYVYDENTRSGKITTVMCFEIQSFDRKNTVKKEGFIRYEVEITVAEDGFLSITRKKNGDPGYDKDDIFPESMMKFSEGQVPSWALSKLEARNTRTIRGVIKSDLMSVTDIHIESYVQVGKSSSFHKWYEFKPKIFTVIGEDGCIDIFFRKPKAPPTLDPSWRPRYCMGRCTDPAIVNSGL